MAVEPDLLLCGLLLFLPDLNLFFRWPTLEEIASLEEIAPLEPSFRPGDFARFFLPDFVTSSGLFTRFFFLLLLLFSCDIGAPGGSVLTSRPVFDLVSPGDAAGCIKLKVTAGFSRFELALDSSCFSSLAPTVNCVCEVTLLSSMTMVSSFSPVSRSALSILCGRTLSVPSVTSLELSLLTLTSLALKLLMTGFSTFSACSASVKTLMADGLFDLTVLGRLYFEGEETFECGDFSGSSLPLLSGELSLSSCSFCVTGVSIDLTVAAPWSNALPVGSSSDYFGRVSSLDFDCWKSTSFSVLGLLWNEPLMVPT